MNKKGKIILIIIINILIIGILGWLIFDLSVPIKYMDIENYPKTINTIEGRTPYLFKTKNESIILIYSKYNRIQELEFTGANIFLIISKNGLIWEEVRQLTNDTYRNIHPIMIQQNESAIRLYYASISSDSIRKWKYIESQNLINWTNPIICDKPLINPYYSEIKNPPFFKYVKEYPEYFSLIKNSDEKFILVGDLDTSINDVITPNVFITKSNDGKNWDIPIRINKEVCKDPSIIEIQNHTYLLAFQHVKSHTDNISIITFSDSDLKNVSGPHIIVGDICIIFFVFCLIIIFIIDYIIIRSILKK